MSEEGVKPEPKPKAKKPAKELPPVGSAARKALVLQGKIKE